MRGLRATVVAGALCLLAASPAGAAPGGPDPAFGRGGWVTASLGDDDAAFGVVRTADGRTVVAGSVAGRGGGALYLAQYLANGRPDTSFGSRGVVRASFGGTAAAFELEQLPDGRLVVVGMVSGKQSGVLAARFTSDGRLDPSYGTGGWVASPVGRGVPIPFDSKAADDGAVAVVGVTLEQNLTILPFVKRLLPDGRPDTAFGPNGTVVPPNPGMVPGAVVAAPDGTVVVAGSMMPTGSTPRMPFLTRFLPNGLQDPTFGSSAMTNLPYSAFLALTRTPQGLYLAAGGGPERGADGGPTVGRIVRFLPTGTFDLSFGTSGVAEAKAGTVAYFDAVGVLPDGRVVATGDTYARTHDVLLARFSPLGTRDTAFGRAGVSVQGTAARHEAAADLAVGPDGALTVAGYSDPLKPGGAGDSFVARFLP